MLPKQILWLWLDFGSGADFKHFNDALVFSEFLLYIHSSTNPVVYGTILEEYRLGFCRYIRKFCPFIARFCMKDNQVHPGPPSANHNASRGNSTAMSHQKTVNSLPMEGSCTISPL